MSASCPCQPKVWGCIYQGNPRTRNGVTIYVPYVNYDPSATNYDATGVKNDVCQFAADVPGCTSLVTVVSK